MRKGAFFLPKTDERVRMLNTATGEKVGPEAYLDSEYFSYATLAGGKTVVYPNIQKLLDVTVDDTPAGDLDGENTEFTFSNPVAINTVRVFLNGVRLHPTTYALTTTTLTLNEAPEPGDKLRVFYGLYQPDAAVTGEVPAGDIDGINTVFALANSPSSEKLDVYLNGILQELAAFTIAANLITFTEAPYAGDLIEVDYKKADTSSGGVYNVTPDGAINGANAVFTLAVSPASAKVYLNGVRQRDGTHYTLAGDTLTFSEAPYAGDWILIDYEL